MKDIDGAALRPRQPRGAEPHLSFEVYFDGEDVEGQGGPYRQFFTDVSEELQINADKAKEEEDEEKDEAGEEGGSGREGLGLLIASRNMREKAGRGKDNFALNPVAVSSQELNHYHFLGVLMGVCIRTNANLNINLPTLVWKQLVGQRLNFDDIGEFDAGIPARLGRMLASGGPEDFEATFSDMFFTTALSDGTVVELEADGAKKPLTFENRSEYARKALYRRLKECEQQCDAVKRGICQIVPEALLNMVSYQELEEWIFGKKNIDAELLARNTVYAGGLSANDECVQWFWEIFAEMPQEQRRMFIQFCYAQSTIPPSDEEFARRAVRFQISSLRAKDGHADGRLPTAQTCFFNFAWPRYSSKEVARRQLLLAISADNKTLNAEQDAMNFARPEERLSSPRGDSDEY